MADPNLDAIPDAMDEDIYEDAGDLNIPSGSADAHALWITRVPKFLWEAVADLDTEPPGDGPDEPIRLGAIKIWSRAGEKDPNKHKARLVLDRAWKTKENVPKHYSVGFTRPKPSSNTYVFTEKDMPGYNRVSKLSGAANTGASTPNDPSRVQKNRRKGRRAIPKSTALVGIDNLDASCNPIENEEYRAYMKSKEILNKKQSTLFSQQIDTRKTNNTDGPRFFKNLHPAEKRKHATEERAARIPENELIDQLVRLMNGGQYKYWPLKVLKQHTRQPETYLKETLQKMAVLIKSGSFANNWTLQERYAALDDGTIKNEAAPDTGSPYDDDDGDEVMEDVLNMKSED